MVRFRASEGYMAADVHEILVSNTLVCFVGLATIVTIEGGPHHLILIFRVLTVLESAGKSAIVHLFAEVLELLELDYAVSIAVDLVPRIVDLLLKSLSIRDAALLLVRNA